MREQLSICPTNPFHQQTSADLAIRNYTLLIHPPPFCTCDEYLIISIRP